jgi:glutathione synthase/RimK-type ligase-like ATP-grasp enzyme
MILICGIPTERPLALVRNAVEELGAPHVVVNQRHFDRMTFHFQADDNGIDGELRIDDDAIRLTEISGVYIRLMDDSLLPELREEPAGSPRSRRCRAFHAALTHWSEITPARVLNRTGSMASNASKPYQAQIIRKHGFDAPETLITNDPQLAETFIARHRRVIYKSISGVRSIVRTVTLADVDRLDAIRWCPVQFQEFLEGTNIRVHVVGGEVFPTEVRSAAVDYRYAARDDEPIDLVPTILPATVSERCITLARALGLEFAGIDLLLTNDGRWFCFEVNPSPGFNWFESMTGQPIAAAVARLLASGPA